MGFNWLGAVSYAIDKIPFEKLMSRPKDRTQELRELKEIFSKPKTIEQPEVPQERRETNHLSFTHELESEQEERPKVRLERKPESVSTVTTAETVQYQNREIGKILLQMERHASQKFRIAGRICDCGQSRHLLDLESMAEETISMVENPQIYFKILDYVKEVGPKATVEAVTSGKYDDEYPSFVKRARDLRKELLGTLEASALFPPKDKEVDRAEEPVTAEAG